MGIKREAEGDLSHTPRTRRRLQKAEPAASPKAEPPSPPSSLPRSSPKVAMPPSSPTFTMDEPIEIVSRNLRWRQRQEDDIITIPDHPDYGEDFPENAPTSSEMLPDEGGHEGLKVLGKGVSRIIQAVKELRDSGVEEFTLELPKICVVGDQSSGKSSLIEGLSEIKVPRGEGTCTRSPLEINLQQSEGEWECTITLVKKYNYMVDIYDAEADANPLGPWTENASNTPGVDKITFIKLKNKKELPHWLECAQLATLNPSRPPNDYRVLPGQLKDRSRQVPFSPCVVRLDISAHNLTNLSFYDLPGLIQLDADPYVPALIKQLAVQYMQSSSCLILYTQPMNHDVETSSTGNVIFEMGFDKRTVGVLTKPDTINAHQARQWVDILRGQRFKLTLGYRVVKNAADSSVEHAKAREEEEAFFSSSPLFRGGQLDAFQDKLGTVNLLSYLSEKLLIQYKESLPIINAQIDRKINIVRVSLDRLPKPPSGNVAFLIQNKISEFARVLSERIDGAQTDPSFFPMWHRGAKSFQERLFSSQPDISFSNNVRDVKRTQVLRKPSLGVNRQQNSRAPTVIIDDEAEENTPIPEATKRDATRPRTTKNETTVHPYIDASRKIFTIAEIRGAIETLNTGIPGARDPRLIERMYTQSIQHWEILVKRFLEMTESTCGRLVTTKITAVFQEFQGTELFSKIHDIAEDFLKVALGEQRKTSSRLLNMERSRLMTLNKDAQETSERMYFEELQRKHFKYQFQLKLQEEFQGADLNKVNEAAKRRIKDQVTTEEGLQNQQELHEMATTMAYYQCAASRFVDYNALSVRNELFIEIRDGLPATMSKHLDLNHVDANKKLTDLLAINPEDRRLRATLQRELDTLENAKGTLRRLFEGNGAQNQDSDGYGFMDLS